MIKNRRLPLILSILALTFISCSDDTIFVKEFLSKNNFEAKYTPQIPEGTIYYNHDICYDYSNIKTIHQINNSDTSQYLIYNNKSEFLCYLNKENSYTLNIPVINKNNKEITCDFYLTDSSRNEFERISTYITLPNPVVYSKNLITYNLDSSQINKLLNVKAVFIYNTPTLTFVLKVDGVQVDSVDVKLIFNENYPGSNTRFAINSFTSSLFSNFTLNNFESHIDYANHYFTGDATIPSELKITIPLDNISNTSNLKIVVDDFNSSFSQTQNSVNSMITINKSSLTESNNSYTLKIQLFYSNKEIDTVYITLNQPSS